MRARAADALPDEEPPSTRREPFDRAKPLRPRAIGPAADAEAEEYVVTIAYREPGYAQRNGVAERIYHGSFTVRARDEQGAVRRAVAEFHEIARLSSVGWVRVIDRVVCERQGPRAPAS